jgi:2'-5' RNA ligase
MLTRIKIWEELMTKFRGFIAIDIKISSKLTELTNEIKNIGSYLKLVEPENIHITIKFLGETEERLINDINKIIKNSIKNINSFNIKLQGTGVFPNQNYIKVIWVGLKNAENIEMISKGIDESLSKLGFTREKRGFSPHLTIARVKSAKNKERLLRIIEKYKDVEFADFKVDSIKLKKSELTPKGPIYTTLLDIKF